MQSRRPRYWLLLDERGQIQVEYIIVVLFAGIAVAVAMATLGPKLVETYAARRAVLYAPVP
jgi:hypothetical protein